MLREIRGQVFVWIGILGALLTIIGHWSNFITLADWVRYPAGRWVELLHLFWSFWGSLIIFYSSFGSGLIYLGKKDRKDRYKFTSFVGTMFIVQASSLPVALILIY